MYDDGVVWLPSRVGAKANVNCQHVHVSLPLNTTLNTTISVFHRHQSPVFILQSFLNSVSSLNMSEPAVPVPDAAATESVTVATTTTSTAIDARLPQPVAPRDMFYDLTVYIPPKPQSGSGIAHPGSTTSSSKTSPATPPTDYDRAITRVTGLAAFLTPNMRCSLTSMLSVVHSHLLSPAPESEATDVQTLIARVASTEETSDLDIKDFVDTIEKGLIAFTALGGGSLSQSALAAGGPHKRIKITGSLRKSSHRSQTVRRECERRDGKGCQICNSVNPGEVVHIIPYSVTDSKGIDFWKFVELFRGRKATAALKAVALAPTPESVDQLKNVWYLCKQCHSCFGGGKLAVIPDVTEITFPFDSAQTTSVRSFHISCWSLLINVLIVQGTHRVSGWTERHWYCALDAGRR